MKTLMLNEGLLTIQGNAFSGCDCLVAINIPNSVTTIGGNAFNNNLSKSLIGVYDPNNLITDSFNSSTIVVNKEHPCNIIYENDSTFVIDYKKNKIYLADTNLKGKNIVLPKNVNNQPYYIAKGALSGLTDIESLTLYGINETYFHELFINNYISYDTGEIPESLKEVIIDVPYSIPFKYFSKTNNIEKLTLSKNVSGISQLALSGCNNLKELTLPIVNKRLYEPFIYSQDLKDDFLPANLTTVNIIDAKNGIVPAAYFEHCNGLKVINLPENITSIEELAFKNCRLITSINLPTMLLSIGNNAFKDCTNLTTINNYSVLSLQKGSDSNGCVALYATTINEFEKAFEEEIIGEFKFYKNTNTNEYLLVEYLGDASNVTLPDNLNYEIHYKAFYDNDLITSITINSGITKLPDGVFSGCSELTTVNINAPISVIPYRAFFNCRKLENLIINYDVTCIESYAFAYCMSLTSMDYGNNLTSIGDHAFYYCESLESINLGNVSIISESAFSSCESIKEVNIPNSVTRIESWAFASCTSIENIHFGNNVTYIGSVAFYKCSLIYDLFVPTNIETVIYPAFNLCEHPLNIYYLGEHEEGKDYDFLYNFSNEQEYVYYYSEQEPTSTGNYWHYDNEGNAVIWE